MEINNKEKRFLFATLTQIRRETHECNIMLKQICKVINTYVSRHHQENEDDFMRNVLANLISSGIDLKKITGK